MAEAVIEVVLDNLSSLIQKEIGLFLDLKNMDKVPSHIGSLQYLSCSKIEGLHEALQHMIALQSLSLSDLPNLASLPNDLLGNLGLLQELEISNCPKLVCLPMSIQHLTSLKQLGISGCSELGKRCKENTGEDWHKIAHIQHIQVKNQSHEARVIFRAG
ncbi:hypothetical protein RYX36_004789 [Vicia faba]